MIGKKALVTGASRGLGRTIAQALAQQGMSLTLIARNTDLLQQTRDELPKSGPQSHSILPLDLMNINGLSDHQNSFQDASVLVNCAGITNHTIFSRMSQKEISDTINLNLVAPMILSRMAYKPMLKQYKVDPEFKPIILNISSILALPDVQIPGSLAYSVSKAGLDAFTLCLSTECRGKIRVNSILPGLIKETDMGANSRLNVEPVSISQVVRKVVETIKDQNINGQCIVVK